MQRFIQLSDDDTTDLSGGEITDEIMQYAGINCWQSNRGIDYVYSSRSFEYTSQHTMAQQAALATTIMGATAWGLYLLASCVKYPPFVWLGISAILVGACISQGIMFIFFQSDLCSDTDCSLSTSSKCGIAACVFWGLSSIMTCGVFKDAHDRSSNSRNDEDDNEEGGDQEAINNN